MRGLPFAFLLLGVISVLIGMAWGIQMSASGDHSLSPAHAHLNLLGYVSFFLFALYYHAVPAAVGRLAQVHFAVALAGVVVLVPGIVMAITGTGEALAKSGSLLTLVSMLIFLAVVIRSRA